VGDRKTGGTAGKGKPEAKQGARGIDAVPEKLAPMNGKI